MKARGRGARPLAKRSAPEPTSVPSLHGESCPKRGMDRRRAPSRLREMSHDQGGPMLRLYAWSYRLAVIGALILAAGAGKKWGP